MKNYILGSFAIGLLLVLKSVAVAGIIPGSGIESTFHDLSLTTGPRNNYGDIAEQTGKDRICIYCHAPHNGRLPDETVSYTPLWNHATTLISDFTMYSSGKAPAENSEDTSIAMEVATQPGAVSLLCLSCHDGSIAISAYGYNPSGSRGSASGARATGRILIGGGTGDLRNHHPIGFYYIDAVKRNGGLKPLDTLVLGANRYGLTIEDLLWNGRVECTTCHDVHNGRSEGSKFTYVEDRHSNFCLSCHRK